MNEHWNTGGHESSAAHEERRFVWRSMDAYLAGQLTPEELARVEDFLARSPQTQEFAAAQREFAEAVRHAMNEPSVPCPDDLHDRVVAALDRCDAEMEAMAPPRFPWMGAALLAAASVMVAVGIVFMLSDPGPEPEPGLPARLVPVVSQATLEAPRSERCRYRRAVDEYRRHFPDGPEIPNQFGEQRCRVSDFHCDTVDGQPVMCAVFDAPEGERFALMIFKGECLGKSAPEAVRAAELVIDGKRVWWWRSGRHVCALVAKSEDDGLRRRMEQMRAMMDN